jgi:hypothetical protein
MASVKDMNVLPITYKADTDLTGKQYFVLAAASTDDYVKVCTAACDPTPLGVQQDDVASAVGEAVEVAIFGPTYAQVAACDLAGNACPIGFGDFLACASDGKLRRSGSGGVFNARSLSHSITTACNTATIPVFFYGFAACALGAS